jgi:hypothetical protein
MFGLTLQNCVNRVFSRTASKCWFPASALIALVCSAIILFGFVGPSYGLNAWYEQLVVLVLTINLTAVLMWPVAGILWLLAFVALVLMVISVTVADFIHFALFEYRNELARKAQHRNGR